jgi:hypothetical protein
MPNVVDPLATQRQAQERADADARKKRLGLTGSGVVTTSPVAEKDLHGGGSFTQSVSSESQVQSQRKRDASLAGKVRAGQVVKTFTPPTSAKGRTTFSDEQGD